MFIVSIWIGKLAQVLSRLTGSNGTALPGFLIERIYRPFLSKALTQLPEGVIIVTGTNGKTTTTKLIAETLEAEGYRVLTNKSGSNFVRGVISLVVSEADVRGRLHKDIAVLEQDEAYAVHFVRQVRPRGVLVLNIMRDQMDRFGEIDTTANMLATVTESATEFVVLNESDPRVSRLQVSEGLSKGYFTPSTALQHLFPQDDEWHTDSKKIVQHHSKAETELMNIVGSKISYSSHGEKVSGEMKISGLHNYLNAAAAIEVCRQILQDKFSLKSVFTFMSGVDPAFGRGEAVTVKGRTVRLQLVKNPAGFTQSLKLLELQKYQGMLVAINDEYADGRDMSWLWDVDFSQYELSNMPQLITSGTRAYDMAVRLKYDTHDVGQIECEVEKALAHMIQVSKTGDELIVFCTYTAMLEIRKILQKAGYVGGWEE